MSLQTVNAPDARAAPNPSSVPATAAAPTSVAGSALSPALPLQEKQTIVSPLKRNHNVSQAEWTQEFKFVDTAGVGGFGLVLHGTFRGQDVAYKGLPKSCPDRTYKQKCLELEAEALASICDDEVVQLVGVVRDTASRPVGIIMPFIDGITLAEHIRDPMVAFADRLQLAKRLAGTFERLHSGDFFHTVTHRDFKPENVLVCLPASAAPDTSPNPSSSVSPKLSRVVLIDFGMARSADTEGVIDTSHAGAGTLRYCAPEQLTKGEVTHKVDVYAFGVALPEILTGKPWIISELQKKSGKDVVFPACPDGAQRVWAKLETLCLGCTAVDPEERPDFTTIAEELRTVTTRFSCVDEPNPSLQSVSAPLSATRVTRDPQAEQEFQKQLLNEQEKRKKNDDDWQKRFKELESRNNARFNVMKESEFAYSEEDKLGEGQGGQVYRVRYNGADIAAKFIKPGDGQDEKQAEINFRHELAVMQHTPPHPNVVGFLGGSVSTQPHVLGIALMRGSLEKLLLEKKESPLDFITARTDADIAKTTLRGLKQVLWYLVGASAGLVQLHAHGVVHCDVAARNFLVDFNSNGCVCDFGMSQILPEGQLNVQTRFDIPIPLAWCAPETITKREWSFKTDVYMFGVMIVELMTRNAPYFGENVSEIVPLILDARKPYRPHIAGWWPNDLADLAMECMAHQPHERPVMFSVNRRLYRFHDRVQQAQLLSDVYSPFKPTKEVMLESNYKIESSSKYFIKYVAPAAVGSNNK